MGLGILLLLSLGLAVLLVARPALGSSRAAPGGPTFAFVVLIALPAVAVLMGVSAHVERSRQTTFCTSCHVMERHGRSLHVDDATLLAASHYQGGRIPRDSACFTCHTTYTMYGDFNAKLRGLKHVWVNYLGKVPAKFKLYEPYHNRECLHCHEGTRRYMAAQTHQDEGADKDGKGAGKESKFEQMRKNQLSCVSSDCHGSVHAADEVDSLPLWDPTKPGKPAGGKP